MTALEFKDKGNAALKEGRLADAIEAFTAGLKLEPDNAVLLSNRSATHAAAGQYEEALADAEAAIAAKPDWGKAYGRAGLALLMIGRGEDAANRYKAGLKVEPDNQALIDGLASAEKHVKATELTVLGEEAVTKRKWTNARDFFKQATDLAPHSRLFWSNLADAYTKCYQYDEAIAAAERCMALSPQWHRGAQRKAEALQAARRFEEALPFYSRALQLAPPGTQGITHALSQCQAEAFNARRRADYEKAAAKQKEEAKKADDGKAADNDAKKPKTTEE